MWRDISTAPFEMVSPSGNPVDADPWLEWCLLWIPDEFGGFPIVGGMDAGTWLFRGLDRACSEIETEPTHWAPLLPKPTLAGHYTSDRVYDGIRTMSPDERKAHDERVTRAFANRKPPPAGGDA